MKWVKKGRIYTPNKALWWSQIYGIIPTPDYIQNENLIRIYFASTDENKFGRISFIEVNADNPSEVLYQHTSPILDIGKKGSFDDCGVNPTCIITINGKKVLYYVGYQRSFQVPYLLLTGAVQIGNSKFEHLQRIKSVPILERTESEPCIRSAPTIIFDNDIYRMWYVSAHDWELINSELFNNRLMPVYTIRYAESQDGMNWNVHPGSAITYENDQEFGFGRPWVLKDNNVYKMWYSIRRRNKSYRLGYAISSDGLNWTRKDDEVGIDVSCDEDWDSQMICYAAIVKIKQKTFMFYNGNNNGETGFGYAELASE